MLSKPKSSRSRSLFLQSALGDIFGISDHQSAGAKSKADNLEVSVSREAFWPKGLWLKTEEADFRATGNRNLEKNHRRQIDRTRCPPILRSDPPLTTRF